MMLSSLKTLVGSIHLDIPRGNNLLVRSQIGQLEDYKEKWLWTIVNCFHKEKSPKPVFMNYQNLCHVSLFKRGETEGKRLVLHTGSWLPMTLKNARVKTWIRWQRVFLFRHKGLFQLPIVLYISLRKLDLQRTNAKPSLIFLSHCHR